MVSRLVSLLMVICVVNACSEYSGTAKGEIHPDLTNVLTDSLNVIDIVQDQIKIWDNYFSLEISEINHIDFGSEEYSIVNYTDFLIFENHILVLDSGKRELHKIGLNGKVNKPVTISGRGPGELLEPISLFQVDNTSFYVADRVNGIHHFNISGELLSTNTLSFLPDYICSMDGHNFIMKTSYLMLDGIIQRETIFEIDTNSRVLNKYSQRYNHKSNMLVYNMVSGPIKCFKEKHLIINTYELTIPLIELHDVRSGDQVYYKFNDINPFVVEYDGKVIKSSTKNYGTRYHQFRNINILNQRFIVAQFREVNRPQNPQDSYSYELLSYVLDTVNEAFYYTYSIPQIVGNSDNKILFKNTNEPHQFILAEYNIKGI